MSIQKIPTRLSQLERKSWQPKVTNPFILCRTRCNKNEHFVKTFIAISNKACNLMNPCHEKKSRIKFSLSFVFPEKYFSLCFFVFPVSRGHERNLLHHSQLLERVNFKMTNKDCCVVLPSCLSWRLITFVISTLKTITLIYLTIIIKWMHYELRGRDVSKLKLINKGGLVICLVSSEPERLGSIPTSLDPLLLLLPHLRYYQYFFKI